MRISDWSSDVCSSDLSLIIGLAYVVLVAAAVGFFLYQTEEREKAEWETIAGRVKEHALILDALAGAVADRVKEIQQDAVPDEAQARAGSSEERRVGKEWVSTGRSWWWPYH